MGALRGNLPQESILPKARFSYNDRSATFVVSALALQCRSCDTTAPFFREISFLRAFTMRGIIVIGLLLVGLPGCMPGPMDGAMVGPPYPTAPAVVYPNPVFVPIPDNVTAWETVVDVIDEKLR